MDLYLYKGSALLASSGGGTSNEEVDLVNPEAGNDYIVYVHGFDVPANAHFTLFRWLLGATAAGNMVVTAPGLAAVGETGTIKLSFSGLAAATKYLGSVVYGGIAGMPDPTIVRVDKP